MEEIYKKIDDYDNYEISNLGNVRNINTNRILKLHETNCGYLRVSVCKDGIMKKFYIHRLVALHFIPNPQNLTDIDHIDQNKTNNSISNLRWVSRSNNNRNKPKMQNKSSKYIGVSVYKPNGKYQAQININNKNKHIGYYETEDDAGKAWDDYIKQHILSEFYNLNFPES